MDFNAHEAVVEVKVEVDVQEAVEIVDEVESQEPYLAQNIDRESQLHNEAVNLHLLTSTALLQSILSEADESRDPGNICPHCGKIYKTATTLNSHCLLIHPPDEQLAQCSECFKVYPSAMSLQKHVQYMHKFKHRCAACYKGFESTEMLGKFGKRVCVAKFNVKSNSFNTFLDNHKTMCCKCETLCPGCGKICTSQVALRNHIAYKHPENTENWCFTCRRSFRSVRGLANHNTTAHPKSASGCLFCHRTFNSNTALHSHLLYKHKAAGGVQCAECHKMFSSQASLARHTLKNHPFQNKVYVCGVCMSAFKEANELQEHVTNSHKEQM